MEFIEFLDRIEVEILKMVEQAGYKTAENPIEIYDFNATIMHLMGLDHERLSFYHNGLERRLTNVHGHVIKDILA